MGIEKFPNKLKMFRHCRGYSQKKVAHMLGLADTSMISEWERGITFPRTVHAFRLAQIYNTLPHELFAELWHQVGAEHSLLAQNGEPITSNQTFHL